jgi:hypothetical protein
MGNSNTYDMGRGSYVENQILLFPLPVSDMFFSSLSRPWSSTALELCLQSAHLSAFICTQMSFHKVQVYTIMLCALQIALHAHHYI